MNNKTESIIIKNHEEVATLREAGKILASIIQAIRLRVQEGMSTLDVDRITEEIVEEKKVIPAFKGYRGFPGTICISVNEEIVHGIPGSRIIQSGDLVSIDIGIIYQGFYSDSAFTIGIGDISQQQQNLMDVTRDALYRGIEQVKVGQHLSDISHAIQSYIEKHRLAVVKEFVGHGIGRQLHEEPEIPNFGPPHTGPILKEGMVLAIEPMVNLGDWKTKILDDGWTVVTADGKPSAHFEHTVAVTATGPEILTA